MRWQHCLDHVDNIQKLTESPGCLLGVVTQSTDSRLSKTNVRHDEGIAIVSLVNQEHQGVVL